MWLSYSEKLTKALNDMRQQNQLCDIIINVGGRSFHAHKAILAASCTYFMTMFTSGFRESTESEISIEGDPHAFEVLLEYAYTGDLKALNAVNAHNIFEMACYMQFMDAIKECADKIISEIKYGYDNVPLADVFKMLHVAKCQSNVKQLMKTLKNHLRDHFKDLKTTEVFLQTANHEFLEYFLTQELLSSEQEETQVSY